MTKELLKCIGEVYVIEEQHMDTFTGIAGSGPAYYLLFNGAYGKSRGPMQGSPRTSSAREIIAQTILGAAKMVQKQGEGPSSLREKVTSPNGTTAAGLQALELNGGGIAISEAVKQASQRSKSLSEDYKINGLI